MLASHSINIPPFKILKGINPEETESAFSHLIYKGINEDENNTWFIKDVADENDKAFYEVVAQEIFRLFVPSHPKVLTKFDKITYVNYVCYQEVPEFQPLANEKILETISTDIRNGKISGLGEVLVISLFLNERDLKLDNIGLDKNHKIIKIDGGKAFASINESNIIGQDITAEDIRTLPFIYNYDPLNWLDIILMRRKMHDFEQSYFKGLADNDHFRLEVNRALLKVILLPHEVIMSFIEKKLRNNILKEVPDVYHDEYMDYVRTISAALLSRAAQIKQAACQNESFVKYLVTQSAKNDVKDFITHLTGLDVVKDISVLGNNSSASQTVSKMEMTFQQLRQTYGKMTTAQFNAAVDGYKNYKDTFFKLRWLKSSPESLQLMNSKVDNLSDNDRYKVIDNYINEHPERALSKSFRKVIG